MENKLLLQVWEFLLIINNKIDKIMTKQDQMNAIIQEFNDATNQIASELQTVIANEQDNVSQESLDALRTSADNLRALGASQTNPVPGGTTVTDTGATDTGTTDAIA